MGGGSNDSTNLDMYLLPCIIFWKSFQPMLSSVYLKSSLGTGSVFSTLFMDNSAIQSITSMDCKTFK